MPKEFSRKERVADMLQVELSTLLHREIADPRIKDVTVTAVDVARNFAHAKVFITTLNDDAEAKKDLMKALKAASGFMRSQLAKRVQMRTTPELRFIYDDSVQRGYTLSELIEKAVVLENNEA
jgi:ribosome-binding factor A